MQIIQANTLNRKDAKTTVFQLPCLEQKYNHFIIYDMKSDFKDSNIRKGFTILNPLAPNQKNINIFNHEVKISGACPRDG